MRRGWIKVIKQAIWGSGARCVSEQNAPGQKTSERSPPAAAHHKISQGNEGNERRTDSEADRVRTEPQNLGRGSEKEMAAR